MSQDNTKWYARIVERDGKTVAAKLPLTDKTSALIAKRGYKPYLGMEENRFPGRRTIAFVPVEINDGILSARVYENQKAEDYDKVAEDYLLSVRVARGYTRREPSPMYDDSTVPRWAQDAKDWKSFFTAVMLRSIEVQNILKSTGKAPTFAEFEASLPKIRWTFE